MSSPEVRAAARALVTGGSWPAGLPYRETVEQVPAEGRPTPGALSAWCTLGFEGDTDDPIGIGPDSLLREEGRVVFRCFAEGGEGDTALGALVSAASTAIRSYAWGGVGIFPRSLSAPQPIEDADESWSILDLVFTYEREHAP